MQVPRHALRLALAALAAWLAVRSVLAATGGEPSVPLDDAFIHFQYARSFVEGRGFSYTGGAAPAPGATSLLWPLLLSVPYALGLRAESLIWAAWLFGFASLAWLGHEMRRAGDRILSPDGALAAELMVFAFGGFIWFAASGMEVVPLAAVLLRSARRAAEHWETAEARTPAGTRELVALAWLAPLVRPEGTLATLLVGATLALVERGKRRALGMLAVAGALLPALVQLVFTGQSASTTARVKWLPFSPYVDAGELARAVGDNLTILLGTLLDGRVWSAVFLPEGAALCLWPALPALLVAGHRRGVLPRAVLLTVVGLGIAIPTTYDSFLWNRLRYLWPFFPAWLLGVAALGDGVGALAARFGTRYVRLRLLSTAVVIGALLTRVDWTLDDLATSADAIRRQQSALGRWAATETPKNARLGVNDTGAIAYFSSREVFDVVGLTTAGEARHWVAGPGSRFEHYERLPRSRLPSLFVVYPEWFALPALLGEELTERSVPGATILGGETMVARVADYRALGTGALPRDPNLRALRVVDVLDVADLESEAAHGYELHFATAATNAALADGELLDGGRRARTGDDFELELAARGFLAGRFESEGASAVALWVDGKHVGELALVPGGFRELVWELPASLLPGRRRLALRPSGGTVASLHYWSLAPPAER